MTQLFVVSTRTEGGEVAAHEIGRAITHAETPQQFVLGLTTGSTPSSTWQALATRRAGLELDSVRAFALDDYLALIHRRAL